MFRKSKKRTYKKKTGIVNRVVKSVISVVILTAFVLAISLSVKQLSSMNPEDAAKKMVRIAGPVLVKVGISPDKAGEVAGAFADRVFKTNINPSANYEPVTPGKNLDIKSDEPGENDSTSGVEDSKQSRVGEKEMEHMSERPQFKVALVADAHNNSENLTKALNLIKSTGTQYVFFLGDYTDFGIEDNLIRAKETMDTSGLTYYSLPGDRDLYKSVGVDSFNKVFGEPQDVVSIDGTKFVLLDNSANYSVINADKIASFKKELEDASYVILSQPLYHPLVSVSKPVMGFVNGETVIQVKAQADEILSLIRTSNVKAIFAGDHHSFSRYYDDVKPELEHIVIGPITEVRSEQSKTSVTILSIYLEGEYQVEELFFE